MTLASEPPISPFSFRSIRPHVQLSSYPGQKGHQDRKFFLLERD